MKRIAIAWCAAGAIVAATAVAPRLAGQQPSGQAAGQQPAQQQQPRPEVAKTHLKVGDAAPDFQLRDHTGKTVKLASYRGKKNVVLAFYVLAHTGG